MLAAQGPHRINLARRGFAGKIQPSLEIGVVRDARAPADENLRVKRLDRAHRVAQFAGINGQVAPAEHDKALRLERGFDDSARLGADFAVARQKELADRVIAGLRQDYAQPLGFRREKFMRNLHEDAAAIPELGIGSNGAAMIKIEQDLQAQLDDFVARRVMQVGDESNAAGVVFLRGIVEALGQGQQGIAAAHDDISRARAGLVLIVRSRHDFVLRAKLNLTPLPRVAARGLLALHHSRPDRATAAGGVDQTLIAAEVRERTAPFSSSLARMVSKADHSGAHILARFADGAQAIRDCP